MVWFVIVIVYLCLRPINSQDAVRNDDEQVAQECAALVQSFSDKFEVVDSKEYAENMMFMFHIPKTAGRTFNSCLWKAGVPPQKRCSRAYDWLHLDEHPYKCKVLASHDDYSILRYLPDKIAFLTVFRDPVTRFISAYEFGLEAAVRSLGTITKRGRTVSNFNEAKKFFSNKVQTRSVWPWMYIIPEFEIDARARIEKLKQSQLYDPILAVKNATYKPRNASAFDQYNNPFYMPMEQFIQTNIAFDLVHNGATFQLLGIANNTHGDQLEAEKLRKCAFSDENSRQKLLELAKRRLDGFLYIGITERMEESLNAFASDRGWKWSQTAYKTFNVENNFDFDTDEVINSDIYHNFSSYRKDIRLRKEFQYVSGELSKREIELNTLPIIPDNQVRREELLDVRKHLRTRVYDLLGELSDLMYHQPGPTVQIYVKANASQIYLNNTSLDQAYYNCIVRTAIQDEKNRARSFIALTMKDGRGVQLKKEARHNIPESILEQIRGYNTLDDELFKYANEWLDKKVQSLKDKGIYQEIPPQNPGLVSRIRKQMEEEERRKKEQQKKKQQEAAKKENQQKQQQQQKV
eukprot:TRINITY_DN5728_c0_g2_i2.p1 TRINITY_DN5728_c0_g2~~TRINITY_DN5728_c0_g2_i2.p1  ORF type:complete len:587 (-),score=54.29 TRINITY_DN5728_c0_g2_i2:2131-3861(-)